MCHLAMRSLEPTAGLVVQWHFAVRLVVPRVTFLRVEVGWRLAFWAAALCSTPYPESFIRSLFTPNVAETFFLCRTKTGRWSFRVLVPTLSTSMASELGSNSSFQRIASGGR